jgi:hypothetical protein
MKQMAALIMAFMVSGTAPALPLATYTEALDGQCNGTDAADGFLDTVAEGLALDMMASTPTGGCQMVSNLLMTQSTRPSIDLQIRSSAITNGAGWAAEGTGEGNITYYFQVTGPADTFVDITVAAVISISGSRAGSQGSTYSSALGSVTGLPGGQALFACSWFGQPIGCAVGPGGGLEQAVSYSTTVQANQAHQIVMQAVGRANAGGDPNSEQAEVQIIVDPVFGFVNPADAEFYVLEFSPNMAPVPLPATAALLPTAR